MSFAEHVNPLCASGSPTLPTSLGTSIDDDHDRNRMGRGERGMVKDHHDVPGLLGDRIGSLGLPDAKEPG